MKQVLQSLKDGTVELADVPAPDVSPGALLIHTVATLVSAGTERMLMEFGKANWIEKARQQPDKVRMVLEKVRSDGLMSTIDTIQSKLDQPVALGYCNVGRVEAVGPGVTGFAAGDRVVSNGKHAQVVTVPRNLCAKIPDSVSDEHASFTVLAAIALQGIRLAAPTLGECIVVTGLGLIGLLTVQMLRAQGCRVLGVDMDPERLSLARRLGAEVVANPGAGDDVLAMAAAFSRGRGVDAVIIAASSKSNEPVAQAARMSRKRGRIVLVGITGLELSRADFFEKELTFQVSCSYGPGRYDPAYENEGHDYPVGFVRWTEQRNFEAVLDLMASGQLDVEPLISHRFPLEKAADAYHLLSGGESSLGIVLHCPEPADSASIAHSVVQLSGGGSRNAAIRAQSPMVAFLGAGNYAGRILIPAFQKAGATLRTVVSAGGVSAVHYGRKHDFELASTDAAAVYDDPAVAAVVVATRHDAHAGQVLRALRAGKAVFCEKPLCLTLEELAEIEATLTDSGARRQGSPAPVLMVGFNRRFAPHVVRMRALLATVSEPKSLVVTVNAGAIPADHWTQNREVGGGRLIGEGCHFIDLVRHLVGQPVCEWRVMQLGTHPALEVRSDKASISMRFQDGSMGVVHYLANGHRGFPKERVEIFCAGRVLQLDNFRKLRGWGWSGFSRMNLWGQDKGQAACAKAFVDAVRTGVCPIPHEELLEVSRISIEAQKALGS